MDQHQHKIYDMYVSYTLRTPSLNWMNLLILVVVEKEVEVLIGEKAFPLVRISQQVYQRGSLPLLKFCTYNVGMLFLLT